MIKVSKGTVELDSKKLQRAIKLQGGIRFGVKSGEYPDGTSVDDVAKWQEFGTKHIPARPFLRNTIKKNRKKWVQYLAQTVNFYSLGKKVVLDIKKTILDGKFKPLSPVTIQKKGFNRILYETGLLYDSIAFERIKK